MTTSDAQPWRWYWTDPRDDRIALLRCSSPRPWTLGEIYSLRAGFAFFCVLRPAAPGPLWPSAWVVTDWVAPPYAPPHTPAMLTDAIRRAMGYFQAMPADGLVIYRRPFAVFDSLAGLAEVGFVQRADQVTADGRVPWHLPVDALPDPIRRRTAKARARSAAGFNRGVRI
jgi:hypothetical protein